MRLKLPDRRFALLALLLVGACGGLLDSKQALERTYWLTPLAAHDVPDTPAARGLVVSVEAVPGLDSDSMLTLAPDAELNHFSGGRWPDHLPEFIGSLLRRSIVASGRFERVTNGRGAGAGDCLLDLQITRFYTVLGGAGELRAVDVALLGELRCDGRSEALAVARRESVSGAGLVDVVAAHQAALDAVTADLLGHLDASLSRPGAP